MNQEKFNKKLLVEGIDDQHVIWALCQNFKLNENFDIIDCKGIDKLINQIPLRIKLVETLGIIIDADTNIEKRWHSLSDLLSKQGFNIPKELPNEG